MKRHKKTHCYGDLEGRILIAISDTAVPNKRVSLGVEAAIGLCVYIN
jgi:hypothetical protein